MTTLDPSHIPSRKHDSRGQAVYDVSPSRRFPLPIPDLRFEQSYLKSIAPYVRRRDTIPKSRRNANEKEGNLKVEEKVQEVEAAALVTRVEDLPNEKPSDIYAIEWQRVTYITFRDQVISPLLQGLLWGVAGFYLRPLISQTFYRFRMWRDQLWRTPTRNGREGSGVGWLRACVRGFMGGVQNNAGLAR